MDSKRADASAESRFFPPTLILEATDSMRVMQAQIFGPILPIVTYSSIEGALGFINASFVLSLFNTPVLSLLTTSTEITLE